MVQPCGKGWQFLKKLNVNFSPAIPLLWNMKTCVCIKAYKSVFIVVLFIVASNWEEPKCASAGEWVNKTWSMEYDSAIRNEVLTQATMWMECKDMLKWLYDSMYVKYNKKIKRGSRGRKKISGCGAGVGCRELWGAFLGWWRPSVTGLPVGSLSCMYPDDGMSFLAC